MSQSRKRFKKLSFSYLIFIFKIYPESWLLITWLEPWSQPPFYLTSITLIPDRVFSKQAKWAHPRLLKTLQWMPLLLKVKVTLLTWPTRPYIFPQYPYDLLIARSTPATLVSTAPRHASAFKSWLYCSLPLEYSSSDTGIPCFSKVCMTPLRFYKRPTSVTCFHEPKEIWKGFSLFQK